MQIFPYRLPQAPEHGDRYVLEMPWDARIVDVRSAQNIPTMHATVSEGSHEKERTFLIFSSEEDFDDDNLEYVGTAWVRRRDQYMHVYEEKLIE